ncbi:hypothetical protein M569_11037 [Genlisea aurea]|uniref:Uncharacterized protein n=1 Tax=Genlisea aurea TaxID=192259 RepID=S8DLH5_9LAMI|nr:hypothetical protein M569_11037 [Genlisea aurea]
MEYGPRIIDYRFLNTFTALPAALIEPIPGAIAAQSEQTRLEEKSHGSFDPNLAGELPEPIPGAISAILEPIVWVELNSVRSVNFCKCSDDDLYYRCLPVCRDFSVRDE